MTVQDLIQRLQEFPPDFPVFVSADDDAGRAAWKIGDVVIDLIDPARGVAIEDTSGSTEGFVDAVVLCVHEPPADGVDE
ncbi:MAG: hypothetical protein ACRDD1_04160 [Planctomycetia bacterium]